MVRLANRCCRRVFHTNHLHLGLFFHLLSTPPPFQSDEEPVCQKPIIEAHCEHHHCEEKVNLYKACQERVVAKGSGHCEGYAFDLWHCIDHCVSSCMRCPVIHVQSEHICVATVVSLFRCFLCHHLFVSLFLCLGYLFFFVVRNYVLFQWQWAHQSMQAQSQIFNNLK